MIYFCVYKYIGKIAKMTTSSVEAAEWLVENKQYGEVYGVEGTQFQAIESMMVNGKPALIEAD